jgi:hypothetical protein
MRDLGMSLSGWVMLTTVSASLLSVEQHTGDNCGSQMSLRRIGPRRENDRHQVRDQQKTHCPETGLRIPLMAADAALSITCFAVASTTAIFNGGKRIATSNSL